MTAESDALVVLARLLPQRLVVVDVGARWGFAQAWDRLRDKCLTIGFEPDEERDDQAASLHVARGAGAGDFAIGT